MPRRLWGGPGSVRMAQGGECQPRHDPATGGFRGGDESWAAAKAGRALPEIPTIWGGFFFFLGTCEVFACFPLDSGAHPPAEGGTPREGLWCFFFFPFLGKDERAEQQGAAETGPDERASPAFPLPARGAPAGDGDAGAPWGALLPGKRGREASASISGTGWRRTEKQHRRGAAPTGDEHHPAPSIAAAGPGPAAAPRHCPRRILPRVPQGSSDQQPKPEAVARRNPLPHPPLTLFSPLAPAFPPGPPERQPLPAPPCARRRPPPWSATTAPASAKPASPATMPPAPSSPPSWGGPGIRWVPGGARVPQITPPQPAFNHRN